MRDQFSKIKKILKSLVKKLALTLIAFLILYGLLEMGARFYTARHPLRYEHEMRIEDQGIKVDNKASGEKRIFVVGESAVEGSSSDQGHSMVHFLSELIRQEGYFNIKVIDLGMANRHSFYEREYADALVKYGADGVILYAGNNDSLTESAVYRDLFLARLDLALTYRSRFYALLKQKFYSANFEKDQIWIQSEKFKALENEQRQNKKLAQKRFQKSLQYYERNMTELVKKLKKRKVPVWIAEIPIVYSVNADSLGGIQKVAVKEEMPFRNSKEKKDWAFLFEKGLENFSKQDWQAAIIYFERAKKINAQSTQLQNVLYEAYFRAENLELARKILKEKLLQKTKVRGGHPGKTVALERIAQEQQLPFVFLQQPLESFSESGILGKDLFLDESNPNAKGHKIIASVMMEALCESRFVSCKKSDWREQYKRIAQEK